MKSSTNLPLRASLLASALAAGALILWEAPVHSQIASMRSATPLPALVPAPLLDELAPGGNGTFETAVFAGGCFWGVQGVFQRVQGVTRAVSGYSGGEASTAHYEVVGSGNTGHAESVEITYDPARISFGQLLRIYFSVVADPTQKDRQGADRGTQYRSAIFAQDAGQRRIAEAYIDQLGKARFFGAPIATTVEDFKGFYPAEDYHQDFLFDNPTYPYIAVNDIPKVEALHELFPDRYRETPVLVKAAGTPPSP